MQSQTKRTSAAPQAKAQTDEKIPSKSSGRRGESPSGKGGSFTDGVYTIELCVSRFPSKGENSDQNTPSNSPRARGTTSKFVREFPRLREEHKTKPCNKKTRPQKSMGFGEKCPQQAQRQG